MSDYMGMARRLMWALLVFTGLAVLLVGRLRDPDGQSFPLVAAAVISAFIAGPLIAILPWRRWPRDWFAAATGLAVGVVVLGAAGTGGAGSPIPVLLIPVIALSGVYLSAPALAAVTAGAVAALTGLYWPGFGPYLAELPDIANLRIEAAGRLAVEIPVLVAGAAVAHHWQRRIRQRLEEQQTIARVRRAVNSSLLLDRVYEGIRRELARVLPVDGFDVVVALTGSDGLEVAYVAGDSPHGWRTGDTVPTLPESGSGWIETLDGRVQVLSGGTAGTPGFASTLRAAMGSRTRPSGYITIRSLRPEAYSQRDAQMLARVASEVTATIDNARYHSQVVRAAEERVQRMRLDAENAALEAARRKLAALNDQLEAQNRVIRESRERMLAAEENAKRVIAEELHGPVQTRLFALWMTLQKVRADLDDGSPAAAERLAALDRVIDGLDRVREDDIRLLSHRLHPSIVRVSAGAALSSLRDFYEGVIPVELRIGEAARDLEPPGVSRIPEDVRLAVHRVADAALGNVMKHAAATECVLSWDHDAEAGLLRLSVTDNGRGFAPDARAPSGLGLVTISDYVDAMGGQLSVTSFPGEGTRVDVTIPFTDAMPASAQDPDGAAIGTVLNIHWASPSASAPDHPEQHARTGQPSSNEDDLAAATGD